MMSKMSELDLTVKEIYAAAQSLISAADSLTALFSQTADPTSVIDAPPQEVPKPEPTKAKPLTLEQVRSVLADKSRDGHTVEVRTLLEKYGGSKLSDISSDHYAELLKDAEGLK